MFSQRAKIWDIVVLGAYFCHYDNKSVVGLIVSSRIDCSDSRIDCL